MTIYALSSGPGIAGIAVVRISGKDTSKVIKIITNNDLPIPRVATLRKLNKINIIKVLHKHIQICTVPQASSGNSVLF